MIYDDSILLSLEFSHSLSLDASGGRVFLNLLGAAQGSSIRAAASTQPFGCSFGGDPGKPTFSVAAGRITNKRFIC